MEVIDFPARRSTGLQYTRFMDSMIVTNNSNTKNDYECGTIKYQKQNFWHYGLLLVTQIEVFVLYIKEYIF